MHEILRAIVLSRLIDGEVKGRVITKHSLRLYLSYEVAKPCKCVIFVIEIC